jgi:hypothetical protein
MYTKGKALQILNNKAKHNATKDNNNGINFTVKGINSALIKDQSLGTKRIEALK